MLEVQKDKVLNIWNRTVAFIVSRWRQWLWSAMTTVSSSPAVTTRSMTHQQQQHQRLNGLHHQTLEQETLQCQHQNTKIQQIQQLESASTRITSCSRTESCQWAQWSQTQRNWTTLAPAPPAPSAPGRWFITWLKISNIEWERNKVSCD